MAFCNSCGAPLTAGTKFCNRCGVAITASSPAPAMTAPAPGPPPTTGSSSALKIILIVIAIIIGFGILGIATVGIIGYHVAKSAHITQNGDHVKVDSAFGSFESSRDPEQTTKDLGIEIYPGAQVQKNGTASVTVGSVHTFAANFESKDSVDKVCSFYKAQFPKATVTTSDQNHCTIVSSDQKNLITINVQGSGDTTKLQITNVSKNLAGSN